MRRTIIHNEELEELKEENKRLIRKVENMRMEIKELQTDLECKEIQVKVFSNLCDNYNTLLNKVMDFIKEKEE